MTEQTNNRKNDRRDNILRSAATLFGQIGFDGTSFATVAERAGEKKSLVQYHFENKDVLWKAAVSYVWSQRNHSLPRYLDELALHDVSSDNQQQWTRELFSKLLQFTFDQPEWVKIMLQESSTPGPRLDWLVKEFIGTDFVEGKAMVEFGQRQHLLPQVDPMDLLHILSGALIYLVNVAPITERVLGVKPDSKEYRERHIDTLMQILMAGVKQ